MNPLPPSAVEADELGALDDSTAPTTPEGSLTFSPPLRPQDDAAYLNLGSRANSPPLSSALSDAAARASPVRNICCVGAGFVGEFALRCAQGGAKY
jgi:UDPglucose 6-dehydrogenase